MSLPRIPYPAISSAAMPLRIVIASLGPIPLTVIQFFEENAFQDALIESIQRDLVLAHMGMNVKRDFASNAGEIGKRPER